ncbi:MAG: cation diffusion facilitator family transporter [Variibacter sp.]|nr:cation diffusion facilitator family transporter [Variibacter sp.]
MQDIKERVALTSIAASGGLTVAKGVVGFLTGSLAILSEAAHSFIDLIATIMTYAAVRASGKPADDEHHYGHGKIESFAALVETALLFLLSGIVIWEAAHRLFGSQGHAVEATAWAFGVIVVSIVVDFFRARTLYRVAEETSSEALEADALHFGSDMWSSIAVLFGLGGVWLGYPWADATAALVVAFFVLIAGWRLASRTFATLTDEAPAGVADRILKVVRRIPGVVDVDRVRVRRAGPVLFAELSLGVSRTLPLDHVDDLRAAVAKAVKAELPEAEVNVLAAPRALSDETVLERVLVIARNQALAVHHVTVHTVGEKLSISLDLEVDGALTIIAAHDIASRLERAIAAELGAGVEVETHIEPLQIEDREGADAAAPHVTEIARLLAELAASAGTLREVHNVRVRETREGEIVNFHCRVAAALTVEDVHSAVDEVERGLRRRAPAVKRVIGHAEPAR